MHREELKKYLNSAIDSVSDEELINMFNFSRQPDMYAVVEELTSLKGEIKKSNNISLKLNNNIQTIIEKNEQPTQTEINTEVKDIINSLIIYQDFFFRTSSNFFILPTLEENNFNSFSTKFLEWSEGFKIQYNKWNNFTNTIGLKITGNAGEQFNPNFHEAIAVNFDDNISENQIVEAIELGYLYNNILFRRAKVIVNKHKNN